MARGRPKGQANTNEYGTGTLKQNPTGSWSLWRMIDGKRYKRTAASKTAVRAAMGELEKELAAGTQAARSAKNAKLTVSEHLDEWLIDWMPNGSNGKRLAPSSQDRHHAAAKHIRRLIGDRPVSTLTPQDVAGAFSAMNSAGQSRASIVKVANTLSLALQRAVVLGIAPTNVAANRKALIPASASRTQARTTLSADDARTLLDHLRGVRNGLAFGLSLRLALRPGEAWGLYWSDLTDNRVNIVRGVARDGSRAVIRDELKVESARRTLSLPADLAEWIEDHRAAQAVERSGVDRWRLPDLVFATSTGNVVDPKNARALLARECEAAGVPVIRPNELRHSCATLLANEGVPDEAIASLLGHVDTRMVRTTYTKNRERPVIDVAASSTWASKRPTT